MTQTWFIGCSGYHYRHWKERFYPIGLPQRRWFEFYSQHFNTLELNVTFYRFPQVAFLQNWYAQSPATYRFSVKAPRLITHYKQFHESAQLLADFYQTIQVGLQEKLGAVLFQLPPKMAYTPERLQRIVSSLDPAYRNVLEPRHVSWWQPGIYEELAQHGISFCGMSHPELPRDVVANTDVLYYRLHGVPELYKSPYAVDELRELMQQVKVAAQVQEVYIYFNNDIDASAILNAKQLQELMS
ncbi:DUF72 domain-containing protein [Hymenobacter sp. GOD-10R]|uniref:DUF72 domain-containing protein n=1 Tax=Hymenobacter sp. GOD-10R TaxID=3093922 RepID=UPI002D7679A3|nr:DUF72 domain-containing protein [Hymenobacter sp. GOD-10R]WRQ27768.1 DUF72 domain-containing protein [Hymenobacter sp. GOD-10R]